MEYKITTYSEEETIELAQNIESEKFPNMVICLRGDLGSGKTVFTKAFAHALGINDSITSPTFNIIKEYQTGELPLYHMDVYRLEDGNAKDLGIEDYFNKGGITIIEWADMIKDCLPEERLDVKIKVIDENVVMGGASYNLNALKARILRTYPSLLRDFHFYLMLKECNSFDKVTYSCADDIKGTDITIVHKSKKYVV